MDEVAIETEDAVVSYREDVALGGVSLEVKRGEFVGIIGPNGAGKTTLLTLINGLGRLLHGQVQVLGLPVNRSNGGRLRKRVGYVAQVQNIDPRLPINVRETVMVGCYGRLGWLHRPTRAHWEDVKRVLETVGLAHLASRPIGHLSAGEQQRVAIARVLIQQPEIFLLDEPTASLDWRAQREILNLVRTIHDTYYLTTLFVTHDLNTLPRACHRVVLMKEGKIWQDGAPESVLNEETLSELYSTPISITAHANKPLIIS
jgi:ABC-type cobalamin/Fe3+-siderophores transport system ATPase subunit